MNAFLFCTSSIPHEAPQQSLLRLNQWIHYYQARQDLLGVRGLFLIDDGSPLGCLKSLECPITVVDAEADLPDRLNGGITVFRFKEHLGRKTVRIFPGWWRSFVFSAQIAEHYGFNKIIHCESDALILQPRMFDRIRSLETGWNTFWTPHWNMPETAIQVMGRDVISKLRNFSKGGAWIWETYGAAERTLPFTNIFKQFKGDRYGEYLWGYPFDADYACQLTPGMAPIFIPSVVCHVFGFFRNRQLWFEMNKKKKHFLGRFASVFVALKHKRTQRAS